jgi:hypothetical protein
VRFVGNQGGTARSGLEGARFLPEISNIGSERCALCAYFNFVQRSDNFLQPIRAPVFQAASSGMLLDVGETKSYIGTVSKELPTV